jgi:hypothetical protein
MFLQSQMENLEAGKGFHAIWVTAISDLRSAMMPRDYACSSRTISGKFVPTGDYRNMAYVYMSGLRVAGQRSSSVIL